MEIQAGFTHTEVVSWKYGEFGPGSSKVSPKCRSVLRSVWGDGGPSSVVKYLKPPTPPTLRPPPAATWHRVGPTSGHGTRFVRGRPRDRGLTVKGSKSGDKMVLLGVSGSMSTRSWAKEVTG